MAGDNVIRVDASPRYDLSPYLYMQFMEPLGTTDGSVEAAWDFLRNDWREDVIETTAELAPTLIRWGGCFSSIYRWREGVGPRRKPMVNIVWGGMESNRIGTHEFVDFCRRVGAEPFYCVNFESDGRRHWARPPTGGVRSAGPKEAAEWVDYCNNPRNTQRRANGAGKPFNLGLWQIGNETSYDPRGYDCETAARRTVAFAKAMREKDASIELIGWGDSGWAGRMLDVAGEHLQYIAFHHGLNPQQGAKGSPLRDTEYRKNPARTWHHLMQAYKIAEAKILEMRQAVAGWNKPLALTECHFSLQGRNRCEVLSTWAAGVAYARILNVHERNGDMLKIATLADFCGTRWQVNAVMIPTPRGRPFLMPVGRVMSLYRRHVGKKAIQVTSAPQDLDITASRTRNRIFLHVVNTNRTRSVSARLAIGGMAVKSGRVFEIAASPECEIMETWPDVFATREKDLGKRRRWTFPPASVSAVELTVEKRTEAPERESHNST